MKTEAQTIPNSAAKPAVKSCNAGNVHVSYTLTTLILFALAAAALPARADDDVSNEYRLTLSPYHPISGNFIGHEELEYRWNPEENYEVYTALLPGLTFKASKRVQFDLGLRTVYTDNEDSADKLELRPFAGVRLFVPNEIKWNICNYTRYEFRDTQNLDTHDWTAVHRLRSRFGVEFPLTSRARAWEPKTWYGLADVEPFYRFDHDRIDPLRVRGGLGHVLNDHVRVEFIYHAQFTRPAGSSSLQYTENIFRLNIKIGLEKGLLAWLKNPNHEN